MSFKIPSARSGWVPWTVALIFLVLHQVYLARAQPDAPFMDTLRLLHQMEEWRAGKRSFLELWGHHHGHRGLINQALLWMNVEWFGLNIELANRATGAVIFVIAGLLAKGLWQSLPAGNRVLNAVSALGVILVALVVFSWAGFELLTLDLGLPLSLKLLCIVVYFACHAHFMARLNGGDHRQGMFASALAVSGLVIVLAVTMGWSYAFVGAVLVAHMLALAATRGQTGLRAWGWLPAAGCGVGLVLYVVGGGEATDGISGRTMGSELMRIMVQPFYALGSTWFSLDAASFHHVNLHWVAIAGATSVAGCLWAIVMRLRRGIFEGSLLPFYLIVFGGLTAVSVSIARGGTATQAVMASRYYMDLSLFLVGSIWLCIEEATVRWQAGRRLALHLLLPILALVGAAQFVVYLREWQTAPYRALAFDAMNQALLAGVPNEAAASLLQSPLEHARWGVTVMRERNLGVFRNATPGKPCDNTAIMQTLGWYGAEAGGAWMSGDALLSVPNCTCSLKAQVYLPDTFDGRTLTIADPAAGQRASLDLQPGQTATVRLQPSQESRLVQMTTSGVTIPAKDLQGQDQRSLGIFWSGLSFDCAVGN